MNKLRTYVTLEQLFSDDFTLANIQSVISDYCESATTLNASFEQVTDILYDSYYDWFVGYVDKYITPDENSIEITNDDILEMTVKFIRKLCVIYNYTQERYLALLSLYTSQKNNLMNQLSTTESSNGDHRVNDTPQNGGLFTDDNHTSVYEERNNTTTTTTDPDTVMGRIDEIQTKYMNVIKSWCNEFKNLFIPPYNEFYMEDLLDE